MIPLVAGLWCAWLLLSSLWLLDRLAEWHHGYLGLALWAVGLGTGQGWMVWGGLVLLADDAGQHFLQLLLPRGFTSPLHWLYGRTLWRLPVVRRLNRWLDGR